MPRQSLLQPRASFNPVKILDGLPCVVPGSLHAGFRNQSKFWLLKANIPSILKNANLDTVKLNNGVQATEYKDKLGENQGELSDIDEDDGLCPVECVREFKTDEEFLKILDRAKETNSLVVVDFYRTSCGSCKYIEHGFAKLCKGSGDEGAPVIFLKHNVIDQYDEESEVADRLRIRAVPLFHFYKNGVLLEAFPTRDKDRILAAILKYTEPTSQNL
ncbi:thioredoxin-like 4, chloroplastic isoform X1 [Tasmannia lanceolata]|uniref:thioredoxin-like 4, chloroplastic isoform X1 n=1 Tax=Tasmannia lanceolata TaxID=3420 RepID=UPI0040635C2F